MVPVQTERGVSGLDMHDNNVTSPRGGDIKAPGLKGRVTHSQEELWVG